jgi:hypothetical protein
MADRKKTRTAVNGTNLTVWKQVNGNQAFTCGCKCLQTDIVMPKFCIGGSHGFCVIPYI